MMASKDKVSKEDMAKAAKVINDRAAALKNEFNGMYTKLMLSSSQPIDRNAFAIEYLLSKLAHIQIMGEALMNEIGALRIEINKLKANGS